MEIQQLKSKNIFILGHYNDIHILLENKIEIRFLVFKKIDYDYYQCHSLKKIISDEL